MYSAQLGIATFRQSPIIVKKYWRMVSYRPAAETRRPRYERSVLSVDPPEATICSRTGRCQRLTDLTRRVIVNGACDPLRKPNIFENSGHCAVPTLSFAMGLLEAQTLLTEVSGVFVKIVFAGDYDVHLERGLPYRPAARFNQIGQDALYLSPDEFSARVAVGEYVNAGDPPRMLLSYEVERCSLFDLRHLQAAAVYELARQPWRKAVSAGEAPKSWDAADYIRQSGHQGMIDPSRRRPGLWHITLLRWNERGAPRVRRIGEPIPISVEPDFR